MKFSNIFAVVAIAAGAVQALPAPEADVALVEREALKRKSNRNGLVANIS